MDKEWKEACSEIEQETGLSLEDYFITGAKSQQEYVAHMAKLMSTYAQKIGQIDNDGNWIDMGQFIADRIKR